MRFLLLIIIVFIEFYTIKLVSSFIDNVYIYLFFLIVMTYIMYKLLILLNPRIELSKCLEEVVNLNKINTKDIIEVTLNSKKLKEEYNNVQESIKNEDSEENVIFLKQVMEINTEIKRIIDINNKINNSYLLVYHDTLWKLYLKVFFMLKWKLNCFNAKQKIDLNE